MIVSGNIKKKKAIILSPQRIWDLHHMIMNNCERVEYTAVTAADTRISFENIDELLSYDNFVLRRIKELEITGYVGYSRDITIYIADWNLFSVTNYGTTIRCDYRLPSVENETLFLHAFEEWYNKCVASYWLLGKFSISGTVFIPSAFMWFLRMVFGGPTMEVDLGNIALVSMLAIFTFLCFVVAKLINYVDTKILGSLFPAIAFLWGEEEKRYERWGIYRNNILWGGIYAILIGLTVNFLYEILKGM